MGRKGLVIKCYGKSYMLNDKFFNKYCIDCEDYDRCRKYSLRNLFYGRKDRLKQTNLLNFDIWK